MFIFFDVVNSFVAKYSSIFKRIDQRSDFIDQKKFVFVFHDFSSFVSIWIVYRLFVWSRFQNLLKIDDIFHVFHNQQI
jgi:hypothetical protein